MKLIQIGEKILQMLFAGIELRFGLLFGYYFYYDAIEADQPTIRHLPGGLPRVFLSENAQGIRLVHRFCTSPEIDGYWLA
jgi:hypothetical protein